MSGVGSRLPGWSDRSTLGKRDGDEVVIQATRVEPDARGQLGDAWLDRDLSWLQFNSRVLQEALDERNRLLERVKFLAIFSANLDEFFMKRVAVLRGPTDEAGIAAQDRRDRLLPKRSKIISMLEQQASCYLDTLL